MCPSSLFVFSNANGVVLVAVCCETSVCVVQKLVKCVQWALRDIEDQCDSSQLQANGELRCLIGCFLVEDVCQKYGERET